MSDNQTPAQAKRWNIESQEGEVWLPVVGYEGLYWVSNLGRLASLGRWRPQLMRFANKDGYCRVNLHREGRMIGFLVHRLVLEAFVGPCPTGMMCAHLNGIRNDNRVCNLQWATPLENSSHRVLHGTTCRGERSTSAKLSDSIVREIRQRKSDGETGASIARSLGLTEQHVSSVWHRKRWSHVA